MPFGRRMFGGWTWRLDRAGDESRWIGTAPAQERDGVVVRRTGAIRELRPKGKAQWSLVVEGLYPDGSTRQRRYGDVSKSRRQAQRDLEAADDRVRAGLEVKARGRGPKLKPLVILSHGLGRDRQTIYSLLLKRKLPAWILGGPKGKYLGLRDLDLIAFSDPGHEWELTYRLGMMIQEQARAAGVRFLWLRKPPAREIEAFAAAFQKGEKRDMSAPWRRRHYASIEDKAERGGYHKRLPLLQEVHLLGRMTTRGSSECTVSQKIDPIREVLNDLIGEKYGRNTALRAARERAMATSRAEQPWRMGWLDAWGEFVEQGLEPHRMIVGIAADEAGRVRPWKPGKGSHWGVKDYYPLVAMGITKADESRILKAAGFGWVHKSGCWSCHYQPTSWFFMLLHKYPKRFAEVLRTERRMMQVRGAVKRKRQVRKRGKLVTEEYWTSTRLNAKGKPMGLLWVAAEQPLDAEVARWATSTQTLKRMYTDGKLPEAFRAKIAKIDPAYARAAGGWLPARLGGGKAWLTPQVMLERYPALVEELFEHLLSKGYSRGCAPFGDT